MARASVIIPAYNYGRYIRKAVDSVLSQTEKDVEVIVVDDGSTDNTQEILETEYKDKIKYFRQKNQGAPVARNKGIEESTGKYIVFLDADDALFPENIEKKAAFLDNNPDCGWVFSSFSKFTEGQHKRVQESFTRTGSAAEEGLTGDIFKKLATGRMISTPTVMVRREILDQSGWFDVELRCLQDYDLWLRIAKISKVGFINEELCEVLYHEGSISTATSQEKNFQARVRINAKIEKMYPEILKEARPFWSKIKADEYNFRCLQSLREKKRLDALKYLFKSLLMQPLQGGIFKNILKEVF